MRLRDRHRFLSTPENPIVILDSVSELIGKQRRFLRGLGNRLKPTVKVGKEGVSTEVLRSIEEAYANQELIKIKLERSCPLDRKEAGPLLARKTSSHLVQILGQSVLLFRPDEEDPSIQLP